MGHAPSRWPWVLPPKILFLEAILLGLPEMGRPFLSGCDYLSSMWVFEASPRDPKGRKSFGNQADHRSRTSMRAKNALVASSAHG